MCKKEGNSPLLFYATFRCALLAFPVILAAAFAALWLPGRSAALAVLGSLLALPAAAFASFAFSGVVHPAAAPVAGAGLAALAGRLVRSRRPALPASPRRTRG